VFEAFRDVEIIPNQASPYDYRQIFHGALQAITAPLHRVSYQRALQSLADDAGEKEGLGLRFSSLNRSSDWPMTRPRIFPGTTRTGKEE
jgi:hypothetical protein